MIRRPPRSTQSRSSAASDVYKRQENSKNTRIRKGKILTFVPTGLTSAGESRSRFRLELNAELEGSIFSSNALMSTSAELRAGGLVVGNIPMGASGSERGSKMDYLRERRHLPGRVGSGGARAANSRSNYNCERSIQYNTRQFQCTSCPAGSLFKFSTHRPSHGFRARRATGTSLPAGQLPLLLLPY